MSTFKALLLDMDGVLFHGDRALPGADEFLQAISHLPYCFITNNPIRTPAMLVEHFVRLGLPRVDESRFVTSGQATGEWLARQQPDFGFYAVGAAGLHQTLSQYGNYDPETADFVVVGEGEGLDFDTLTIGINLILKQGARLVCTNPDHNVDASIDGMHRVLPGGGALVAPFAVATGQTPVFIGKPHPLLYEMAMQRLGVAAPDCVMVGDRPDTDIAGAAALQMATALVRTGRFGRGEKLPSGLEPDWDCESLTALLDRWRDACPETFGTKTKAG